MRTKISPCLWFDNQAEQAARFYTAIFKNSKIVSISRYGEAGKEIHGQPAGSVMTVEFELNGHAFTALNGGPVFQFSEAISFQIECESQAEVDHYWERLTEGGKIRIPGLRFSTVKRAGTNLEMWLELNRRPTAPCSSSGIRQLK